MKRGVVMQVAGRHIIIMTPDGRFKKVPRRSNPYRIGEEVDYSSASMRFSVPPLRFTTGLAAAAVCCLIVLAALGGLGARTPVVAYVSMDINPSMEFGIGKNNEVLTARGLNADGAALLRTIDYKKRPIAEVAHQVIAKAQASHYLDEADAHVVITGTVVKGESEQGEHLTSLVEQEVRHTIRETEPKKDADRIEVAALETPKEVRNEAVKEGVSPAVVALKLLADKEKPSTGSPAATGHTVSEIAKEVGGLGKLIGDGHKISSDELKQLLDQAQKERKNVSEEGGNQENDGKGRAGGTSDHPQGGKPDGKPAGHQDENKDKDKDKPGPDANGKGDPSDLLKQPVFQWLQELQGNRRNQSNNPTPPDSPKPRTDDHDRQGADRQDDGHRQSGDRRPGNSGKSDHPEDRGKSQQRDERDKSQQKDERGQSQQQDRGDDNRQSSDTRGGLWPGLLPGLLPHPRTDQPDSQGDSPADRVVPSVQPAPQGRDKPSSDSRSGKDSGSKPQSSSDQNRQRQNSGEEHGKPQQDERKEQQPKPGDRQDDKPDRAPQAPTERGHGRDNRSGSGNGLPLPNPHGLINYWFFADRNR